MYVHTCIRWLRAAFRTWSKIFLSAPAPGTVRVCIWACASFALALAIILSDDLEYRCAASAESAAYMRMCVCIQIYVNIYKHMHVCLFGCMYVCMRARTHTHPPTHTPTPTPTPTHTHTPTPTPTSTHLLPRGDTRLLAHQAPICVRKLLPLRRRAARAADELLVQEEVLGLLELDLLEVA